ncbi:MAG: DUF1624 domain-containing protein [Gammaproteobacteria bacterium]|nr:DUF1624 domain-containing protein [Gammaproteobacteria bacterium]
MTATKPSGGFAGNSLAAGDRLRSLDILRGLVIVVMALDHVRDFFHIGAFRFDPLDPAQTHLALYLTRWVTHFCAPVFVFLAGVSVYLQAAKGKDTGTLSRFLLTRGLWLIFLEFTVIGFAWAFSIPFMLFLQVIWAIGASMIALAVLVWLPRLAVLFVGIAIVAGHNLLDPITSQSLGVWRVPWMLLHEQNVLFLDGQPAVLVAYPVLAWTGVMALGYGMGAIFLSPAPRSVADRHRRCAARGVLPVARAQRLWRSAALGRGGEPRGDTHAVLQRAEVPPFTAVHLCDAGSDAADRPIAGAMARSAGGRLSHLRLRTAARVCAAHLHRPRAGDRRECCFGAAGRGVVQLHQQLDLQSARARGHRGCVALCLCRLDRRGGNALSAVPVVVGNASASQEVVDVLCVALAGCARVAGIRASRPQRHQRCSFYRGTRRLHCASTDEAVGIISAL